MGHPDWAGTSLMPTDVILANHVGTVVPAGQSVTIFSSAVSAISYAVNFDALGVAAPVTPFIRVQIIWKDGPGGNVISSQHWFGLLSNFAPSNSNVHMGGRGPTESSFLIITVKNMDTSDITLNFELLKSSRIVTRHDIRSINNNINGTYTFGGFTFSTPSSDSPANILGFSPSVALGPAGVFARINGLYAGLVQLTITQGVPQALLGTIYAFQPEFGTPIVPVWQAAFAVAEFVETITFPRCPCLIVVNNTGGGNATVTYSIIAQEFAS